MHGIDGIWWRVRFDSSAINSANNGLIQTVTLVEQARAGLADMWIAK